MSITVTLHSGHVFTANEEVTIDKLNQMLALGYGTTDVGTIDTAQISDKAITLAKMADLAAGYLILGNASNRPAAVALSSDVTLTATGAATVNNKLADTTQWHADDIKFPEKTTVANDDEVLMEDSAASWAKKKMKLSTIRAGMLPPKYKHNLVVSNNTATPNTKIDIAIEELCVTSASTGTLLLSSVSHTVDATVNGENGLDSGAVATGMYYVWVIYNPTTLTSAGLISLSNTNPTMPSGYLHKRLVGEVYYNTSAFVSSCRNENEVWFSSPQSVYTSETLTTTPTAKNLPAAVPSGAVKLFFELSVSNAGNKNLQILTPTSSVSFQVTSGLSDACYAGDWNKGLTEGYGSQLVAMKHYGATTIYARANDIGDEDNQNCHVWGYVLPR